MGLSHEFKKELFYIKDKNYKKVAMKLLDNLPSYFYVVGNGFYDKYSPEYSKGRCGLVKHTKVAVRFAYELLNDPILSKDYTDREKDLIIISLLLHDGLERGRVGDDNPLFEHPIMTAEYVKYANVGLLQDDRNFIYSVISSHSGIENSHVNNNRKLPLPQSKYQKFVYMCIQLANQSFFDIEFNDNNEIMK